MKDQISAELISSGLTSTRPPGGSGLTPGSLQRPLRLCGGEAGEALWGQGEALWGQGEALWGQGEAGESLLTAQCVCVCVGHCSVCVCWSLLSVCVLVTAQCVCVCWSLLSVCVLVHQPLLLQRGTQRSPEEP